MHATGNNIYIIFGNLKIIANKGKGEVYIR